MKSLVIGAGQIGSALQEIFLKAHVCLIRDIDDFDCEGIEVLHIAYPYSKTFIGDTLAYIAEYKPRLTMIHSSVPVGTTDQCGYHVVHTPERGRYPNLAQEMQMFPKFVGGGSVFDRELAKKFFDALGWKTVLVDDARQTELCKVLSNVHLGLEIAWRQEVDRIHQELIGSEAGDTYLEWEKSYNRGYQDLGHRQLIRPIVRPAPIGGHCILPCTDILGGQFPSKLLEFIKESNAKRKTEEEPISDYSRTRSRATGRR